MHGTEEKASIPNGLFSSGSFVKTFFALTCDPCSNHRIQVTKLQAKYVSNRTIVYNVLRIICEIVLFQI
jgi:hypothetical protein